MESRREHRCRLPRSALRGTVYRCWCRRCWVAVDSVTIRDGKVFALRPDWRSLTDAPGVSALGPGADRA